MTERNFPVRDYQSIRLGEAVDSNSVYKGFVLSLWRVNNGIQVMVNWTDTSGGHGWSTPGAVYMAHQLTWDEKIKAWRLPK